jgi:hypothetical protein
MENGSHLMRNMPLLWSALIIGIAPQQAALAAGQPADMQNQVCKAFGRGANEFAPLQQAWKQTENNTNGVAKVAAQDEIKQNINTVWTRRNRDILGLMPSMKVSSWLAIVEKLDVVERNYGTGTQRYIEIRGRFDCTPSIAFISEQIEAAPKLIAILAKVHVGDVIILDGTLIAHDVAAQPIEDAIEWGGILWGPFGGLWGDDAFNHPAFRIKTINLTVP